MSINRMNFTNRSKLTREQANINIHPATSGPATFDALLDLKKLRPHADDARVSIEAYHQTTRMRFEFGTVASLTPPPLTERKLVEFSDWRDIRFRVKVTDVAQNHGRIVALANRIKPTGPDDQDQPDLVRFRDTPLYGLLWDLDFDDEGPVVQIDPQGGGAHQVGRDDRFIAAVYPEILRRTLEKALLEDAIPHDDPEHWFKRWYEGFFKAKFGMKEPPDSENEPGRREWIRNAISLFAGRHSMLTHWLAGTQTQPTGGI